MRDFPQPESASYGATRDRVAAYFDGSATRVWERLTSDAPVSRIRQSVRAGRDEMRALMMSRMADNLRGARVLDAGCGTGAMSAEIAARGADVVGIDISPQLVSIAQERLPDGLRTRVSFGTGDMLSPGLGHFDYVVAMDSLIYYTRPDLAAALTELSQRADQIIFTVAPRTPVLMAMWQAGKLFPRADRSPVMVPHDHRKLARDVTGLAKVGRVSRGFYISECLEVRA